jgi:hypothetical protein
MTDTEPVVDVTFVTRNKLLAMPERIVKPRVREYRRHPIVAIYGDDVIDENGQLTDLTSFIADLPKRPPTCIVTISSADLLARMDAIYTTWTPESWQFRVANHERDIVSPNGTKVASRVTLLIYYLGWKNGNYHKMLDPVTMYGRKLNEIWPGPQGVIIKLLQWGVALRDFCNDNGIDVRPTTGGISAQLLVDPRFYPDARRKVPACINEAAREAMPGNHYDLLGGTDQDEYDAIYLDQSSAHHYHARTTALPDANLLFASGRFIDLEEIVFDNVPPNFYGLFCLDLKCPVHVPFSWIHTDADWLSGTLEKQFVFSNELPHLLDMGYKVLGVRACWGSRKRDTGIPKYAAWSTLQLDRYNNAPWIKPILLSAYGVLATRPRYAESVFKLAKAGIPTTLRTGKYKITGTATIGTKKLEPRIANVIHRGMIEAATRSESIGLAQHLTAQGHQVLSIYADAVIVQLDEENELPPMVDPWRVKERLTHLQFINQQAFLSGEMTKLPGIGGELRKHNYRAHPPRLLNVAAEMEADETMLDEDAAKERNER